MSINGQCIVKDHLEVCRSHIMFRSQMGFFEHQERYAEFVPETVSDKKEALTKKLIKKQSEVGENQNKFG